MIYILWLYIEGNRAPAPSRVSRRLQVPLLTPTSSDDDSVELTGSHAPTLPGGGSSGFQPVISPSAFACPATAAAGVSCSTDLGCFADANNFVYGQINADGSQPVLIPSCGPKSGFKTIGFLSISDCTNACTRRS